MASASSRPAGYARPSRLPPPLSIQQLLAKKLMHDLGILLRAKVSPDGAMEMRCVLQRIVMSFNRSSVEDALNRFSVLREPFWEGLWRLLNVTREGTLEQEMAAGMARWNEDEGDDEEDECGEDDEESMMPPPGPPSVDQVREAIHRAVDIFPLLSQSIALLEYMQGAAAAADSRGSASPSATGAGFLSLSPSPGSRVPSRKRSLPTPSMHTVGEDARFDDSDDYLGDEKEWVQSRQNHIYATLQRAFPQGTGSGSGTGSTSGSETGSTSGSGTGSTSGSGTGSTSGSDSDGPDSDDEDFDSEGEYSDDDDDALGVGGVEEVTEDRGIDNGSPPSAAKGGAGTPSAAKGSSEGGGEDETAVSGSESSDTEGTEEMDNESEDEGLNSTVSNVAASRRVARARAAGGIVDQ